jgi:hypothetical protein
MQLSETVPAIARQKVNVTTWERNYGSQIPDDDYEVNTIGDLLGVFEGDDGYMALVRFETEFSGIFPIEDCRIVEGDFDTLTTVHLPITRTGAQFIAQLIMRYVNANKERGYGNHGTMVDCAREMELVAEAIYEKTGIGIN